MAAVQYKLPISGNRKQNELIKHEKNSIAKDFLTTIGTQEETGKRMVPWKTAEISEGTLIHFLISQEQAREVLSRSQRETASNNEAVKILSLVQTNPKAEKRRLNTAVTRPQWGLE